VDRVLADAALDLQVDWRLQAINVELMYERWRGAPQADRARAYATYAIAVDREESACRSYASLVAKCGRDW
jgi:hypothetical protein